MISLHKQNLAVGGGGSGDRPMGPSSGFLELCRAMGAPTANSSKVLLPLFYYPTAVEQPQDSPQLDCECVLGVIDAVKSRDNPVLVHFVRDTVVSRKAKQLNEAGVLGAPPHRVWREGLIPGAAHDLTKI